MASMSWFRYDAKEPCISAKEPYISAKDPSFNLLSSWCHGLHAPMRHIMMHKSPISSQKNPVSPQKSPVSAKRALYPCSTWCTVHNVMDYMSQCLTLWCKRALYLRKRALYLYKRVLYLHKRALYSCSTWCIVRDLMDYVTLCHTLYICFHVRAQMIESCHTCERVVSRI